MFKVIKKLFLLLTPAQRKNFYFLQFLVILMALMEIVGVASIIPFISIIGDMSQLSEDTIYAKAYITSGIDSEFNFVIILGKKFQWRNF